MLNNPLVSIIIPTYNRASILEDAIRSALSQTYQNTEIIVVDDGSDDNTREIVKKYPNIQYIYQKRGGQAAARNKGFELANGEFIASLDSDDEWKSNFLDESVRVMLAENVDFTFANWMQELKQGKVVNCFSMYTFLHPYMNGNQFAWNILDYPALRNLFIRHCPSPSSSLLLRRSSIVSSWDSSLNIADDWCLVLDMIMASECRAAFTYDVLWTKRIGGNNVYDGRERIEIIKLLDIEDCDFLAQRYAHVLTKDELRTFRKLQVVGLFTLSLYLIGAEFKIFEAVRIFRKAFAMDSAAMLSASPKVMISVGKSIVKNLIRR